MREAILRVDRRGLLWTISRMFSCVFIVRTTSLSDCTETLGREPVSRNVWWIRVNTLQDGILRSGKRLWYSSTAARALPSQNPYTICISQYSTCENTKGIFSNSAQLTYQPFTTRPQHTLKEAHMQLAASVSWLSVIRHHTQGQTSIRLVSWQVQRVDPPKDHTFLWPLSP